MPGLKRIAVVVQRCHADVVGGSESLAWQYAQLLSRGADVEILTSCALDYQTWDNRLAPGVDSRESIAIRRFPTAFPRGLYFNQLHRRLLADFAASDGQSAAQRLRWRDALCEDFIRFQGPWCPGLIEHLAQHHADYHKILFCTYLYPTTYFGLSQVPQHRRVLVPTLHDEPPAYLPSFARIAQRSALIWLTEAERELGARLWNVQHGSVVGMGVEPANITTHSASKDQPAYLLYCGRIDRSKGCAEMLEAFVRLRQQRREPVKLVLTGSDHLGLPAREDIEFLGFVDEARKNQLMAKAAALVMPSPYESFSIVTLEALALGTAVIVNAACSVLAEHVRQSGAGLSYRGVAGLTEAMARALDLTDPQRADFARRGRDYVQSRFSLEAVYQRLLEQLN